MEKENRPRLVLGATGHVGGRLVPLLLERGWKVRGEGDPLHLSPGNCGPATRAAKSLPWMVRRGVTVLGIS